MASAAKIGHHFGKRAVSFEARIENRHTNTVPRRWRPAAAIDREGQRIGADTGYPKDFALKSFNRKRAELIDESLIVKHAPRAVQR